MMEPRTIDSPTQEFCDQESDDQEYQGSNPVIQVVETQGSGAPLIEHFEVSLDSLEDWACFHGRSLMESMTGVMETKSDESNDDYEDECIRLGTPDILRACSYLLGFDPASLESLEELCELAPECEEGVVAPTLVEEGRIVICPKSSVSIEDPGASQAMVTYFCDGSTPSAPYLNPYQVLTTVFLL